MCLAARVKGSSNYEKGPVVTVAVLKSAYIMLGKMIKQFCSRISIKAFADKIEERLLLYRNRPTTARGIVEI